MPKRIAATKPRVLRDQSMANSRPVVRCEAADFESRGAGGNEGLAGVGLLAGGGALMATATGTGRGIWKCSLPISPVSPKWRVCAF